MTAVSETENIQRALYERYYAAESAAERPLTSSHWVDFGRQTVVELDGGGRITRMRGAGFGKLDLDPGLLKRWLGRLTMASYLATLPERRTIWPMLRRGREVTRRAGLQFNIEAFRQVCSVKLVASSVAREGITAERVLIIGDGYGFCANLLKRLWPLCRLALVDLGKTLLFQVVSGQRVHPGARHVLLTPPDGADPSADFLYCPAEHLDALSGLTFDVAVNMMSMQEMNRETIARYFAFLRKRLRSGRHLFYCCNREVKTLRGGEQTAFLAYPWHPEDRHLIDELCPWWRHHFSTHTSANGPRWLGVRVPLVNYFKPVRHRLTQLAPGL